MTETAGQPASVRPHPAVRAATYLADRLPVLVILLCSTLALATWYRGQQLVWGDDATHPMNLGEIASYFHVSNPGLGAPDARKLPFILPIGAVLSAWDALGIPYDLTFLQPIVVVGLLAIGGWSSYLLTRTLLPAAGKLGALAGGLLYVFNLYSLTTVWSAMSYLSFHYAFLPLVLTGWLVVLTRRVSVWFVLPVAALWSLTLTPAYIATPVAVTDTLLFTCASVFAVVTAGRGRAAISAVGRAALLYGTWLLLNLFWIVPFITFAGAETTRGLAVGDPGVLFALNSASFVEAIRLTGYWGVLETFAGSNYFPWYRYFSDVGSRAAFLLPLIALLGIVAAVRSQRLLADDQIRTERSGPSQRAYFAFFVALLVGALLLMTGVNEPLGGAKEYLVGALGLEGPFRSVYQRFGVYAALAYAPLVAVGIMALRDAIRPRWGHATGTGVAVLTTAALVIVPALPLWTGSAFDQSGIIPSRRITIPEDYRALATILDEPTGDFNVLVFPYGGTHGVSVFNWEGGREGYSGVDPLHLLTERPVLTDESTAPYLEPLVRAVTGARQRALAALPLLNTRFIVLHLDTDRVYLGLRRGWIGRNVEVISNGLERMRGVRLVYADQHLRAYSWVGWKPYRLFAVRGADLQWGRKGRSVFSPRVARRPIPYEVDEIGRFTVSGGALRRGELLVLNQPFDAAWRAGDAAPIRVEPGLTAFDVSGRESVTVHHPADDQFPKLLALVPVGLLVCVLSLGRAIYLRRRERDA